MKRRDPDICDASNIGEGKDAMTKASIDLQDLRRRIYIKAKAEPSWRFSAPNKEPAQTKKPLDRKTPIQVRVSIAIGTITARTNEDTCPQVSR